ncbi:hypothetical protein BH11MYX3_BH11MYX3_44460 [soil metagenome]
MAEIDELRERMTSLENLVRDLQLELTRASVGGFRSMRDTRRCPACGGQHLFHITEALELSDGQSKPLAVHHYKAFWGARSRGPIEYFICRSCLLVESHARDLDGIDADGTAVIAIDPDGDVPVDGPFR